MGNPMPFERVMGPNQHSMKNYGDLQPIARGVKPTLWVPSENLSFGLLPKHGGLLLEVARGPKVGVSNERFSTKVKLRCKLDIHTSLLSPPVYLRRRVGLQCFQGVT